MKSKRIVDLIDHQINTLYVSNAQGHREVLETSSAIISVLTKRDALGGEVSPLEAIRYQIYGPRTDGKTVCPLFLSRFHPNSIRQGDTIIAYKSDGETLDDIHVFYYVGQGWYSYVDHHHKHKLFDYSSIRGAFSNNIRAKINHIHGIDFSSELRTEFKNRYLTTTGADKKSEKPLLQLRNRKESPSYPYLGTQPVNDMYVKQLFDLYAFGKTEGLDSPSRVVTAVNERTVWLQDTTHEIHLNRNSRAIYRDNNFSFGLVDKDDPNKADILIFSFTINRYGVIDIVQIGSNSDYYHTNTNQYTDDQCFLAQQFVLRAKEQGLKKIRVMRGDKIGAYKFPQQYSLREGFTLEDHQAQLKLIYNATPIRKRGRKKPSGIEAEWYSAIKEME